MNELGIQIYRFVSVPLPDLREKLDKRVKAADAQIDELNTKVLYLETTDKNSRYHIEHMLRQTAM